MFMSLCLSLFIDTDSYIKTVFESQAGDLGVRPHAKDFNPGLGFCKFLFALSEMDVGPAGGRLP